MLLYDAGHSCNTLTNDKFQNIHISNTDIVDIRKVFKKRFEQKYYNNRLISQMSSGKKPLFEKDVFCIKSSMTNKNLEKLRLFFDKYLDVIGWIFNYFFVELKINDFCKRSYLYCKQKLFNNLDFKEKISLSRLTDNKFHAKELNKEGIVIERAFIDVLGEKIEVFFLADKKNNWNNVIIQVGARNSYPETYFYRAKKIMDKVQANMIIATFSKKRSEGVLKRWFFEKTLLTLLHYLKEDLKVKKIALIRKCYAGGADILKKYQKDIFDVQLFVPNYPKAVIKQKVLLYLKPFKTTFKNLVKYKHHSRFVRLLIFIPQMIAIICMFIFLGFLYTISFLVYIMIVFSIKLFGLAFDAKSNIDKSSCKGLLIQNKGDPMISKKDRLTTYVENTISTLESKESKSKLTDLEKAKLKNLRSKNIIKQDLSSFKTLSQRQKHIGLLGNTRSNIKENINNFFYEVESSSSN